MKRYLKVISFRLCHEMLKKPDTFVLKRRILHSIWGQMIVLALNFPLARLQLPTLPSQATNLLINQRDKMAFTDDSSWHLIPGIKLAWNEATTD